MLLAGEVARFRKGLFEDRFKPNPDDGSEPDRSVVISQVRDDLL